MNKKIIDQFSILANVLGQLTIDCYMESIVLYLKSYIKTSIGNLKRKK